MAKARRTASDPPPGVDIPVACTGDWVRLQYPYFDMPEGQVGVVRWQFLTTRGRWFGGVAFEGEPFVWIVPFNLSETPLEKLWLRISS